VLRLLRSRTHVSSSLTLRRRRLRPLTRVVFTSSHSYGTLTSCIYMHAVNMPFESISKVSSRSCSVSTNASRLHRHAGSEASSSEPTVFAMASQHCFDVDDTAMHGGGWEVTRAAVP